MRTPWLLVAGRMLALSMALTAGCDDTTGPSTGTIRVSLTSGGADVDPDGYLVSLDGQRPRIVRATDLVTYTDVEPGTHTVQLEQLATNCSADGGDERTVTVTAGREATATFAVICVARAGTLRVTTVTTGGEPDPDGYVVEVQSIIAQRVGANGSVTFPSLRESLYEVRLSDVARNCIVAAPVAPLVHVPYGAVAEVSFAIQCPTAGSLRVTNTTSGPDPDANGYIVQMLREGVETTSVVPTGGSVTVSALLPGTYRLTLSGIAENCALAGPAVRQLQVAEGATAEVAFDVACAPATRLAFVSHRDGNLEIYAIRSNGAGLTRLTSNGADDYDPAWSPDGRRIAFASNRGGAVDIYVMDADGSNVARLTSGAAANMQPAWSPDGSRIAFVSTRTGNGDIYVMNADGTNLLRLTDHSETDFLPSWSPGGKIAFTSYRSGASNIWVMNADGTGVTMLTTGVPGGVSYSSPAWSPDGQRLALIAASSCDYYYYYYCVYDVQLMNADGSGRTTLATAQDASRPAWSPDGRTVAYSASYCVDINCRGSVVYTRADRSATDLIVLDGFTPSWTR